MEENSVIMAFMEEIQGVRFISVDDFMKRKDEIKAKVRNFSANTREVYKWYFYHQLCWLPQKQFKLKDLMWEYVNGERVAIELAHQYRIFCKKRNKINYNSKID